MAEYFPIDIFPLGSYSGSFSGSFQGNGSRLTDITASYLSGSVTSASYAATASYLLGSIASASYALTASYVNPLVQDVIITGSIYIPNSTNSIYFSGSGAASRLVWNDTDGTLNLGLKGGVVSSELGQGLVTRIVNKTVPNIYLSGSNYQVVVVAGAQGQRLAVKLAQADNDANSAGTLGLVAENIDKNQEGFIVTVGLLKNRDTTGALQGETWSDGDVLYLSPTTAGAITNIKPQAPRHTVIVGYVEYAHANNGKIYVKIDNGYELDELHNVRITTASLSSGDLLVYSSSVWINTRQLTGSYGLTGSLQATSFTGSLLGTASNAVNALTASFVNTASTNAFVQNGNSFGATALLGTNDNQSLAFETSGSTRMFISSSGNVGIGTTTPATALEVSGVIRTSQMSIGGLDSGRNQFLTYTNGPVYRMFAGSVYGSLGVGSFSVGSTYGGISGSVNTVLIEGNTSIGTTTQSARLHVRGSGTTSATTALRVENTNASASIVVLDNGFVGINTGSAQFNLDVSGDARATNLYTGIIYARSSALQYISAGGSSLNQHLFTVTSNQNPTSGDTFLGNFSSTFNPTSGTATYANIRLVPIINQTGGANGITRGLYVNPTLTSAADFRAIETTAGNVLFQSGSTPLMLVSSSGNVGIGTATPDSYYAKKLVVSAVDESGITIAGTTTSATNYLAFADGTTGNQAYRGYVAYRHLTDQLAFGTGGTLRATIDNAGNFGVGTSTSTILARTHIQGSGTTSATTALRVENANASASFVVRDNGSVGIGTTTPSVPLEIVGNMIISGGINQRGGAGVMFYDNTGYGGGKINGGYGYLNGEVYITPASGNTFIFSPNSGMSIGGFTIGGTAGSPPAYGLAVSGSIGVGTRTPITQLDVSGSGRFTGNLTVTGSLIATSFTGSLQGTASWATNVVSASGASTNVQYNSSGLLAGNNRFTFDGTTVRISGGSLIITGSSTISGSSIITGSLQVGIPGTNAAAIDTTTGTLSRGPVTTIDWVNRNLQDTSGVTSVDWETKALYDTSAVTSVDWENRILYTPNSLEAFNYSRTTDDLVSSQLYSSNIVSIDVQQNLVSNNLYAGQIISGSIDAGVTAYDIMYLDTDGTWKSLKNLPVVSTKMLGIEVDGNILLDGDMTVSDDGSVGTYVVSADHGLPVYISGTTGRLTTVVPGSDVIRIVGHIYYQDPVNTNVWLMKFRPSNNWA